LASAYQVLEGVGATVPGQLYMRRKRFTDRSGYTLVEVMIASIIMALVLVSVMEIVGRSVRYLSDIRRASRSSQILQQEMENIRLMTWSQIQALPSFFSDPSDASHFYSGKISTSPFDTYSGTTTVVTVTLTITWTNQSANRVLTNTLTTLVCNGGLNKYIL
jgi:prepilin-type N-terminal cleavage/methylation domain-containing protein